jgi:DUF1680 family protein
MSEFRRFSRVRPLPSGSVQWTDGFWANYFGLCQEATLPSMRRALGDPGNAAVLANFAVAAGLQEGTHRGTFWSDGDCYKYVQALAHVFEATGDEPLDQEMDDIISAIAQAQEPDGYVNTQIQLTDKGRWQNKIHHELYNLGHLLTAACVHHQATGKDTLLRVACRAADYLYTVFARRPPELAHFGFNPSNIMGLVDLYRETGEARYLELAGIFVDMRGSQPWPGDLPGLAALGDPIVGDQCQDRVPLRDETQAVGHAVTATYLWAGAADVCAETGDEALLNALQRIWDGVVQRRMYVTGAVGPQHRGLSPRGDEVHEAFAADWDLPNRTAYNETCANIGNAMWNRRLLELTGDARHADAMERVLYNSMLSGMDLAGTRFCYTNPLARGPKEVALLSHDSETRWFTWSCYCCPPNVARTITGLHEWVYGVSDDGLWVHLYGGSRLQATLPNGARVALAQETDYPWDGAISLRIVEAQGEFALYVRVPGWAEWATVTAGDGAEVTDHESGYVRVQRQWRAGDEVLVMLSMEPHLVRAHPLVEHARNQVAVMRGPIVYCLESADLPEGVPLHEVHLPRNVPLTPRYGCGALGGLTVLEGEALRVRDCGEWEGKLYQPVGEPKVEKVPLRLIPYYAWANRGPAEMSVWLPLA